MKDVTAAALDPGNRIKRADMAYVELATSELARDINRDVILELVRSQQPISRADLSRVSGLRASTVSNIAEQLLREKWIVEGGLVRLPRGRRPTLLSLNDDLVILAADIRPTKAVLAVVDLNGRMLALEEIRVSNDAGRSLSTIEKGMTQLQKRFPNKTFEGVGVSVPGRVHPATQKLILAPNLKWVGIDIKARLQKTLGLQVEVDNDANACLVSEIWFGRIDGVHNAVLISLSEGLGTAVLANGHIVAGLNGLAGEFGHIPLDSNGPECGCGRRGCWETLASSNAALRFYADQKPKVPAPSIQDLIWLEGEGDANAIRALEKQAKNLGLGLRMITAALSPEVILITGALTTCWDKYGPIVKRELDDGVLAGQSPKLQVTTQGEMARLRGAAAIALQRHSGYNLSAHPRERKRSRKADAAV